MKAKVMLTPLNTWWLWISTDELKTELRQLEDEGRDVSRLRSSFTRLIKLGNEKLARWNNQEKAQALFDEAQALPMRRGYAYAEPSDLSAIRKLRPRGTRRCGKAFPRKKVADRVLGAWLGRCAGCLLGKPLEGTRSWDIEAYLKGSGQWPLGGYIRFGGRGKAGVAFRKLAERAPGAFLMKDYHKIDHMPIDDDTNYTTAGLLIVQKHGKDFNPNNVAHFWMQHLPLEATCTAERVAYRNLAMNIAPPDSGRFRNPFREWIGAQIRADAFGYVNVGNPERAAEFAWRDACISHVKNGIYGEMWVAAMLAAAPYCDDFEEVIRSGLSEIPKTSRLHAEVSAVLGWQREGISYEDAVGRIHARWDENSGHDWCHTISNAVICAVALLWGKNDFGTSVCRAVTPGYDTDCNGATVGSVFGMMHGAGAIPKPWTARLNNTLKTSLAGYECVSLDKIAGDTLAVQQSIR